MPTELMANLHGRISKGALSSVVRVHIVYLDVHKYLFEDNLHNPFFMVFMKFLINTRSRFLFSFIILWFRYIVGYFLLPIYLYLYLSILERKQVDLGSN